MRATASHHPCVWVVIAAQVFAWGVSPFLHGSAFLRHKLPPTRGATLRYSIFCHGGADPEAGTENCGGVKFQIDTRDECELAALTRVPLYSARTDPATDYPAFINDSAKSSPTVPLHASCFVVVQHSSRVCGRGDRLSSVCVLRTFRPRSTNCGKRVLGCLAREEQWGTFW